ncbi:MAG: 4-hydroxy-3-methylbut-2-enyl diphosphate reductase [Bacilli bacterium]|jgi:4-hydroxy-3-methylbut-2-enyl diphosphate reductase|nr:4-hydroxy-3-methylbut-2-enyl diphosphate reductase [Bacilli bacterium]
MKVKAIVPRGYCYGVVNAINIVLQARKKYPNKKIYILGMIVHNKNIVQAMNNLNIITLDDSNISRYDLLDQIDDGVVILSAHGSEQKVIDKAKNKNLIVIDGACKDVIKTHNVIKDYLDKGYDVIYLGKENHPEAVAALSIDINHIHLINHEDDLEKLKIDNNKIVLTNQTTISILSASKVYQKAKELFKDIIIVDEICNATRIRQEAILNLSNEIDLVYVVGDPKSNNSNKLAQLAIKDNRVVKMIESVNDIIIDDLLQANYVGVTSGASTPTYLTNQVIEYLNQFDKDNLSTYIKPKVDINEILSKEDD